MLLFWTAPAVVRSKVQSEESFNSVLDRMDDQTQPLRSSVGNGTEEGIEMEEGGLCEELRALLYRERHDRSVEVTLLKARLADEELKFRNEERLNKRQVEVAEKTEESLTQLRNEVSSWRERCTELEKLLSSAQEREDTLIKQRQQQEASDGQNPCSDNEDQGSCTEVKQPGSQPSQASSQLTSRSPTPTAAQVKNISPSSSGRVSCSDGNPFAEPEHCRHVTGNPFEAPEDSQTCSHPASGYASADSDFEVQIEDPRRSAPQSEGVDARDADGKAAPTPPTEEHDHDSAEEHDHDSAEEPEAASPESHSSSPPSGSPSKTEDDPQSEDTVAPGNSSVTADVAEGESSQTSEDSASPAVTS